MPSKTQLRLRTVPIKGKNFKFIALLVLSGALGVLGQDVPTPVTYTFGLEHVAIHGRITGIVDGDTIDVLIFGTETDADTDDIYAIVLPVVTGFGCPPGSCIIRQYDDPRREVITDVPRRN